MSEDYMDQPTLNVGIKEEELKKLILELYDYRDKASEILNTAMDLAEASNEYYDSEDGEEFRNKFHTLSANFDVIISMIKSYSEKLESILSEYKANTQLNAEYLKTQSDKHGAEVNDTSKFDSIINNISV